MPEELQTDEKQEARTKQKSYTIKRKQLIAKPTAKVLQDLESRKNQKQEVPCQVFPEMNFIFSDYQMMNLFKPLLSV